MSAAQHCIFEILGTLMCIDSCPDALWHISPGDGDMEMSTSPAENSECANDAGVLSVDTAGSMEAGPRVRPQPKSAYQGRPLQRMPKLPKLQNPIYPGSTPTGTISDAIQAF